MNPFIHQEFLSFGLFTHLFAESKKLLNRRMVVLLSYVLGDKVMDVLDELVRCVSQLSQALHELFETGYFFQVHNDQFQLDHTFTVLNELGHDVDDLLQEILDFLLLPLFCQNRHQSECILFRQILKFRVHFADIAQEFLKICLFQGFSR
jgi:hypothetical protein